MTTKKASTLASFILYTTILSHSNRHTMEKKVKHPFFSVMLRLRKDVFSVSVANIQKTRWYLEILIVKNSSSCEINVIFRINTSKYTKKFGHPQKNVDKNLPVPP
jgi:hypothetical protein